MLSYSAIWGMEDYYDVTVTKREARRLLLTNVQCSVTTTLTADGVELTEMPLRYDRSLCLCTVLFSPACDTLGIFVIMTPVVVGIWGGVNPRPL